MPATVPRRTRRGSGEAVADALVTIEGAEPVVGERLGRPTPGRVSSCCTASPATRTPRARSGSGSRAEGYQVEVPRLPGHGTDVRDLGRTRYADWAAAAEEVVEQVANRTDHLVLVGLSMGGTLTLDIASRRRDLVDAAVVINPQILVARAAAGQARAGAPARGALRAPRRGGAAVRRHRPAHRGRARLPEGLGQGRAVDDPRAAPRPVASCRSSPSRCWSPTRRRTTRCRPRTRWRCVS